MSRGLGKIEKTVLEYLKDYAGKRIPIALPIYTIAFQTIDDSKDMLLTFGMGESKWKSWAFQKHYSSVKRAIRSLKKKDLVETFLTGKETLVRYKCT